MVRLLLWLIFTNVYCFDARRNWNTTLTHLEATQFDEANSTVQYAKFNGNSDKPNVVLLDDSLEFGEQMSSKDVLIVVKPISKENCTWVQKRVDTFARIQNSNEICQKSNNQVNVWTIDKDPFETIATLKKYSSHRPEIIFLNAPERIAKLIQSDLLFKFEQMIIFPVDYSVRTISKHVENDYWLKKTIPFNRDLQRNQMPEQIAQDFGFFCDRELLEIEREIETVPLQANWTFENQHCGISISKFSQLNHSINEFKTFTHSIETLGQLTTCGIFAENPVDIEEIVLWYKNAILDEVYILGAFTKKQNVRVSEFSLVQNGSNVQLTIYPAKNLRLNIALAKGPTLKAHWKTDAPLFPLIISLVTAWILLLFILVISYQKCQKTRVEFCNCQWKNQHEEDVESVHDSFHSLRDDPEYEKHGYHCQKFKDIRAKNRPQKMYTETDF